MSEQVSKWMSEAVNEWNGWVNEWVSEWVSKWLSEWMSKQISLLPLWKRTVFTIYDYRPKCLPGVRLFSGMTLGVFRPSTLLLGFFSLSLGCQSPFQKKQSTPISHCLSISGSDAVCQCFGILQASLLVAENFLPQEIRLILRAKQSLNIASWHRYLKSCVDDVMSEQRRRRK